MVRRKMGSKTRLVSFRMPLNLFAKFDFYKSLMKDESQTDLLNMFITLGVESFEESKMKMGKQGKRGDEVEAGDVETARLKEENEFLKKTLEEYRGRFDELKDLIQVSIAQNSCLFEAGPYNAMVEGGYDRETAKRNRDILFRLKLREVKEKDKFL